MNLPVGLIGSNVLLRDGLAQILGRAGFTIALSASCLSDEAIEASEQQDSIILVVDIDMDPETTICQIRKFRVAHPAARIAVLVDSHRAIEVRAALQIMVDAIICRTSTHQTFVKILELVSLGESFVPTSLLQITPEGNCSDSRPRPPCDERAILQDQSCQSAADPCSEMAQFSAQESRILQQMIGGASNKLIARNMNIAEATVKVHVKTILRKLRVQNRTQAAIWAISHTSLADAPRQEIRLAITR